MQSLKVSRLDDIEHIVRVHIVHVGATSETDAETAGRQWQGLPMRLLTCAVRAVTVWGAAASSRRTDSPWCRRSPPWEAAAALCSGRQPWASVERAVAGHTSSSACRQSRWQPLAHTWMGSCPPWRVVAAEGDSSSTRRAAAAWPLAAAANSSRLAAASAVCTAVTGGMPAAEDRGGQGVGMGGANAAHQWAARHRGGCHQPAFQATLDLQPAARTCHRWALQPQHAGLQLLDEAGNWCRCRRCRRLGTGLQAAVVGAAGAQRQRIEWDMQVQSMLHCRGSGMFL